MNVTNVLAAGEVLVLGLAFLFMVLTIGAYRAGRRRDGELIGLAEEYGRSLKRLDETVREGHLKILRTLKGQHYQGDLAGMDVFADDAIPNHMIVGLPARRKLSK